MLPQPMLDDGGEDRALPAEGREVNRLARLEAVDARITRPVEGDAATSGQAAQELPANQARRLAQECVDVQETSVAVRVRELEKGVDRRLRSAPCPEWRPLDPVVGKHGGAHWHAGDTPTTMHPLRGAANYGCPGDAGCLLASWCRAGVGRPTSPRVVPAPASSDTPARSPRLRP
jgi:hypothetical protein